MAAMGAAGDAYNFLVALQCLLMLGNLLIYLAKRDRKRSENWHEEEGKVYHQEEMVSALHLM